MRSAGPHRPHAPRSFPTRRTDRAARSGEEDGGRHANGRGPGHLLRRPRGGRYRPSVTRTDSASGSLKFAGPQAERERVRPCPC